MPRSSTRDSSGRPLLAGRPALPAGARSTRGTDDNGPGGKCGARCPVLCPELSSRRPLGTGVDFLSPKRSEGDPDISLGSPFRVLSPRQETRPCVSHKRFPPELCSRGKHLEEVLGWRGPAADAPVAVTLSRGHPARLEPRPKGSHNSTVCSGVSEGRTAHVTWWLPGNLPSLRPARTGAGFSQN